MLPWSHEQFVLKRYTDKLVIDKTLYDIIFVTIENNI